MLTFYPEFESTSLDKPEIILLLDCSNSMKEGPLKQAKQILLLTLHHMPDECLFNVVTFGTSKFTSTVDVMRPLHAYIYIYVYFF